MQDNGAYFWRNDDGNFCKASFEILFRSIGLPEDTDTTSIHLDYDSTSILEAAMDVLAMTQPYTIKLAPSPDQLRSAARKLLGESAFQNRYRILRKDWSILVSLLLRLRLREAQWGSRYHFGTIESRDPNNEELTAALVGGLYVNQDEDYLTSGQNIMAMDLLVSLDFVAPGIINFYAGYWSLQRFNDLIMSFGMSNSPNAFDHFVIAGGTRHDYY